MKRLGWKTFWDQATFRAAICHQTAAKHRGEKHVIRSMYFRGGKGPATATRVVLYVIPRGVTFWSWYLIRKCTLTNYLEHRDAFWQDDVHCFFSSQIYSPFLKSWGLQASPSPFHSKDLTKLAILQSYKLMTFWSW